MTYRPQPRVEMPEHKRRYMYAQCSREEQNIYIAQMLLALGVPELRVRQASPVHPNAMGHSIKKDFNRNNTHLLTEEFEFLVTYPENHFLNMHNLLHHRSDCFPSNRTTNSEMSDAVDYVLGLGETPKARIRRALRELRREE